VGGGGGGADRLIDWTENVTIGFEKVFVVNLSERADKRDAMSLAAAVKGIRLEWTATVKGERSA